MYAYITNFWKLTYCRKGLRVRGSDLCVFVLTRHVRDVHCGASAWVKSGTIASGILFTPKVAACFKPSVESRRKVIYIQLQSKPPIVLAVLTDNDASGCSSNAVAVSVLLREQLQLEDIIGGRLS